MSSAVSKVPDVWLDAKSKHSSKEHLPMEDAGMTVDGAVKALQQNNPAAKVAE